MQNDQELNIEELSAVYGGMATSKDGTMPYPKPSPMDQLIKWILGMFK
ncbi:MULTISPECIES: bacteriocin [unclassified Bradyrhizobium]|nr:MULTISPECIES: bacteriocin [unclassified Bradyrhizobium]MBR1225823.1 bacteriocin [Bradyrhizobium sp. AUGA SZCCT0176]MBR1296779.1 bacteriocin [Bradyrhizobium sp. AUGA SZCCT0042]